MKTALYFEVLEHQEVRCLLCPHYCKLKVDERGICRVRKNMEGQLISENYGMLTAVHIDPIEKKPLYHFYPGHKILSVGSFGCNLSCYFCQNCDISQASIDDYFGLRSITPETLIDMAREEPDNLGIAYTYNEPTIYYEFMMETARLAKAAGLKNVIVSNGYINREPLLEILPFMDAFNIDLKAFQDKFYKQAAGAHLRPVKNTLEEIRKAGKHLEITFLLIPSRNDDETHFREMLKWIRDDLGKDTVLHISRFFPAFKATEPKTSLNLMFRFCEMANDFLSYVYLGNVTGSESQNTICNVCGKIAVARRGFFIQRMGIDETGKCIHCGNQIVVN